MVKRLTSGPAHHFFGYVGMQPWNSTGQYHLAVESSFHDRPRKPTDEVGVGIVDIATGQFQLMGKTRAFNFQMGPMMHWIDAGHGEEFTYNDWEGDRVVSRAVQPKTGKTRTLERAIATVSPREPLAIGINFARGYPCRWDTGYSHSFFGKNDLKPIPDDDGFFRIDLRTGKAEILLSFADIEKSVAQIKDPHQPRWIDHVVFNKDGSRWLFICNIAQPQKNAYLTSLWSVDTHDGKLNCVAEYEDRSTEKVGHFSWLDSDTLMMHREFEGKIQYVWLDLQRKIKPCNIPGFPSHGHMAISPDGSRVVTDNSAKRDPEGLHRILVHHFETKKTIELTSFKHPENIKQDWRCDLHPRWSRDGKQVSFDSCHEDSRQIYIADVP